ncbi:zinc finger, C3HC4 type (RING finger) protein (macronuclear) [Tetrahymena thermophila SB210]|uniref:Zinc finger, C3HC4 type (RING finger) protein n=1 Tax=Tetrahymena thermophila (strain SB210) TaxID=312017 RepID=Q232I1_TETTS|nr:zinc finger, C3HC4 type (RING finger) protein [Tetrahymena thermophila SB210]EAR91431.2 zinc finger, C3HC4 type (RING finger) protein [Tetrahymena thermophila SB210]|eukprot:XP_001011676.2 zinc finger, C3HC4 type (RING finger) protein [Tetrahymena thermophila SB210]
MMQEKKFQLEIATVKCCSSQNICNKQLTISNNMIQYDGEKGQYYGIIQCQQCKQNNCFFWCECGHHIISKEHFYDGYQHECTNMNCRKKFSIVKCPECWNYNYFEYQGYEMGKVTKCLQCNFSFQQVACHSCFEDSYFDGNYKQCIPFKCSNKSCIKKDQISQHINCPSCKFPNLFNCVKPLQNVLCKGPNCSKNFLYLICTKCSDPIVKELKEGENKLEYGKNLECKKCKQYICYFNCMACGRFSLKSSDKFGDYGRLVCSYQDCKKKQILLKCEKKECKASLNHILDSFNDNVFDRDCDGCKKKGFFMTCPYCSSGYSLIATDLTNSKYIECQKCNAKVEHNIKHSIQTTTVECKICLEKQATYLVDACNHLFGCEECAQTLKNQSHSGNVKCPICRKQGPLRKVFI